jgi:hypothetical protein
LERVKNVKKTRPKIVSTKMAEFRKLRCLFVHRFKLSVKRRLTTRCGQPLHGANNFEMKTATLKSATRLAVVSGG